MQTMTIMPPLAMPPQTVLSPKTVRKIPAKPEFASDATVKRPKRVAAYCRVSTKKDEQHLSYEAQKDVYTEKIMRNPEWQYVDIYADRGITGTQATKRPDFMRLIRDCKKGKIDLIITKSVTRFARNTLDSLEHVRLLKSMGIGVLFEIQNINTLTMANEMILTMYAGMAQNESENISANVRWGWQRSFAKGKVNISYKSFLGYRKGADGQPEIVPEEAAIVRRIYNEFLMGFTRKQIADSLTELGIPTPMGKGTWLPSTVHSILRNEKYTGDALLGKTYIPDCLTHKAVANNGEMPQYYVENNHPAIIERGVWNRAQEELARRGGKRKVKEKGTTSEQGKYSSKYALTELLICGECGTPYRRVTWSKNGKKKAVWRCISRLDYGKQYCKESPTVEESVLQDAILEALARFVRQNSAALDVLKQHIGMALSGEADGDDPYAIQARIGEIGVALNDLYELIAQPGNEDGCESQFEALYGEKAALKEKLAAIKATANHASAEQSRLDEIFTVADGLRNRPLEWEEPLIRQMVECVKVVSKNWIRIRFRPGIELDAGLDA
ncbi:MAG: recombinase family protein [Oscillospiraceae bacterium]|nr:recombinase family protein [Oscillospiraceae bacterium]